jgi:hypothetical protein
VRTWTRRSFGLGSILATGILTLAGASPGAASAPHVHRVSRVDDPFERDASGAQVSPDGEWIVWIQRGFTPELTRLYAARRWEGSAARPLTAQLAGLQSVERFAITPDSRWVVFSGITPGTSQCEIWSVPIEGSSLPGRLNPSGDGSCVAYEFQLSGVGPRAVFAGDFENPGTVEVWSSRVDRTESAVKLSPPMVAGGNVGEPLLLAPTGSRIVFAADALVDGSEDLWSAPLDGSAPAVRLNIDPSSPRSVDPMTMAVTPDGSRVLYLEVRSGRYELWSAPTDGSALPILLTAPAGTWNRVRAPVIAPSGSLAVFGADRDDDTLGEVWSVPVAGPAPAAVELIESSGAAGDLGDLFFDASGSRVAFVGDFAGGVDQQAWTAPTDGSSAATEISVAPLNGGGVHLSIVAAEGGARVVIAGDSLVAGRIDLWSAPIDGTAPAARLDSTPSEGSAEIVRVNQDSDRLAFVDGDAVTGVRTLWSVASDGSAPPGRLSIDPVPGGTLDLGADLDPTGQRVVYAGDLATPGIEDAWSVPVMGTAAESSKLTPELHWPEGLLRVGAFSPEGLATLLDVSGADGAEIWVSDWMILKADFEEGDASEWSASQP